MGFDRYRWAIRFGQMARKTHDEPAEFSQVMADLEAAWNHYGGPSQLSWDEAKAAINDSWDRSGTLLGEAIAARAGFKRPPTFGENGAVVPRSIDEPNG